MGDLDDRTPIHVLSDTLITINGKQIALTSERDLKKLNWSALGVDYVVECTGKFTKRDLALDHVTYGKAKRVLISAPSSDSPTFVYGVNSDDYTPTEDCRVVSNASCTTNCVTPVLKVLQGSFSVAQGFLTTIHAATRSQQVLDGYSKKNKRLGKHDLLDLPSSHLTMDTRTRRLQQYHSYHHRCRKGRRCRTARIEGQSDWCFDPSSYVRTNEPTALSFL